MGADAESIRRMMPDCEAGWIFTLLDDLKHPWGKAESFYETVMPKRGGEWFLIAEDIKAYFGEVETRPQMLDGIAFYHSDRSSFPKDDPFGGAPRISLVGRIVGITWIGGEVAQVAVEANTRLSRILRTRPLLRDDTTDEIFERCGVPPRSGRKPLVHPADEVAWYLIRTNLEILARVEAGSANGTQLPARRKKSGTASSSVGPRGARSSAARRREADRK